MTTTSALTARAVGSQRRLLRVTLAAALAWSAGLVVAAVLWGTGIAPLPFAAFDPEAFSSLIEMLPAAAATIVLALVGAVGAALAVICLRSRVPSPAMIGVFAGILTVFSTIVVADARIMAVVGYALSLRFVPLDGATGLQLAMLVGSALWIAAAVLAPAGRIVPTTGRPVTPLARTAVAVAVVIPLLYAAVRFAWAAGIPLGITDAMLRDGQESGLWGIGFGLASVATAVALLTLGLVQRWGERLPRWVPWLGGRRVPVALAAVPVTLGGLVIFGGGVMFVRVAASDALPLAESWATLGPETLWPLWGIALGVALTEYVRRRVRIREAV
ncbi:hypothetical protein ACSAGD_11800 [Paramicrobacterium sp. CJ85]|uniref:hypothetical protein n=1 Tax=Paramicrobacterium sp. CJ85 TaxID=3445355 RepID=UPI003F63DB6C